MDQSWRGDRPVGCAGVGQTIILERIRAALRERPRADLQRQELARFARVTPALISYYFPDRSSLFAAVAQPVMDQYIADIREVLGTGAAPIEQLRSLTFLLVDFNVREGHLLDFYFEHAERSGNKAVTDRLNGVDREMIGYFEELLRGQLLRGGCARSLQSTHWDLCKHVAYTLREDARQDHDSILTMKVELIVECFINGASGLLCLQNISSAAKVTD